MKTILLSFAIILAVIVSSDKASAQASQITLADVTATGWKDHRNHMLLLRNNAAEPLTAVLAVKTYRRVPNSPVCVPPGANIYLIVGTEALIHETRTERVIVPSRGEKRISYECFGASLIGEEPVKKAKRRN